MRIRWWQSIRWRLALGSILLVMLATVLLALSAITAIAHYYSIDQNNRLAIFAEDRAQRIGENYTQGISLIRASAKTFPNVLEHSYQGEQYLVVVLYHHNQPVYPRFGPSQNTFTAFALALADPTLHRGEFVGLRSAIVNSQQGVTFTGQLGSGSPVWLPRPFVVQPIFAVGRIVGRRWVCLL